VHFDGFQARAVGRAFGGFARKSGLSVWACSILCEHVHLVIGRHRYRIEQVANLLKGEATRHLVEEGRHPFLEYRQPNGRVPRCWAAGEWKVFLDSVEAIHNAIDYVERNPFKEGKPRQRWSFVTSPFSGKPKAPAL
jgi:REP element-mobilizing transposase RayT